jgi:hypothetical protein
MAHQSSGLARLAFPLGLACPLVIGAATHAGGLPVCTFGFTYNGTAYKEQIVGADPRQNASKTTVPAYIIPVWPTPACGMNAPCKPIALTDPLTKLPDGRTVVKNIVASPLFEGAVKFDQGGTDIGRTQYLDATSRLSIQQAGVSRRMSPPSAPNWEI